MNVAPDNNRNSHSRLTSTRREDSGVGAGAPVWPDDCLVVSIEGIDGVGKSTLVHLLKEHFCAEDASGQFLATTEFESPLGLALREVISDIGPLTRAYAFAAERHFMIDEIRRVRPELVVWDRYIDSTIASRIADGSINHSSTPMLLSVASEIVSHMPKPHATILLDLSPREAHRRIVARGREIPNVYSLDQLKALRKGFATCMSGDSNRFHLVDARLAPEEVFEVVLRIITELRSGAAPRG